MVAVMLLLIAGGIGLAQAVSDPNQVTLRWLRLGGIIALSLIAVAGTIVVVTRSELWSTYTFDIAVATIPVIGQLITVQLAKREWQRLWATGVYVISAGTGTWILFSTVMTRRALEALANDGSIPVIEHFHITSFIVSTWISAGLTGGFLITMLLGHAYLTAGNEMTQKPFLRLVKMLALLLTLRLAASMVFGAWPYQSLDVPRSAQMWNTMMITARYCVGLVVPGVFTYMIWDCVRRRSNQSATGILYVATVLVMLGEGIALGLIGETGVVF